MMALTAVRGVYYLVRRISCFAPPSLIARLAAWSFISSSPFWSFGTRFNPGHKQLSLLISIELLTIPPPTAALPFPISSISALLHPELVVLV